MRHCTSPVRVAVEEAATFRQGLEVHEVVFYPSPVERIPVKRDHQRYGCFPVVARRHVEVDGPRACHPIERCRNRRLDVPRARGGRQRLPRSRHAVGSLHLSASGPSHDTYAVIAPDGQLGIERRGHRAIVLLDGHGGGGGPQSGPPVGLLNLTWKSPVRSAAGRSAMVRLCTVSLASNCKVPDVAW